MSICAKSLRRFARGEPHLPYSIISPLITMELLLLSNKSRTSPLLKVGSSQIQPWDPSSIKDIEKALTSSDLGLTPSNDGKLIRLPIPPLSEERRKELVKLTKKYGEETKVQIRGFRRDGNEELKKRQKDGELTEDDLRRAENDNQKLTDKYVQKVDELLKKKEEEILEI